LELKKIKLPGENISLKTKKTEDPLIMQWLNAQTNLMDSLRYLMEKEISENGVRNLQAFIPMERNMLGGSEAAVLMAAAATTPAASPQEQASVAAQAEIAAAAEPTQGAAAVQSPAANPAAQAPASAEPEEEELDDEDIEAWI
jgi:hypothetical protein